MGNVQHMGPCSESNPDCIRRHGDKVKGIPTTADSRRSQSPGAETESTGDPAVAKMIDMLTVSITQH
jgi:hypothetical protein